MTTMARKVMWIGRATVFTVGLIVVLALILGVATTALAAVPGSPFKLGRINTIDQMSTLAGNASGALLRINNVGSAPALDLRVEEGEAPMNVNSATLVNDLNADQVDGRSADDFISEDKIYTETESVTAPGSGFLEIVIAHCDSGDKLLGGGGGSPDGFLHDIMRLSEPRGQGWRVVVLDDAISSPIEAKAICADFPPLRP